MEHWTTWDRLRRVDPRIWDALLAGGMLAAVVLEFALSPRPATAHGPDAVRLVLGSIVAISLAWRRRAPLVVAVVVVIGDSALSALGYDPVTGFAVVVALYTAAAYRPRRRLVSVLVPLALVAIASLTVQEANWADGLLAGAIVGLVPVAFGRVVFNRHARLARDRDLAAREAVAAERARIARELHDLVAHHMSVMVVQAGAARAVAAKDPAAAAEALRQIEASGRAGLNEMRRLLEILKSDQHGRDYAPQPGLERLDELLDGMRATGLSVETIVEGAPHALPPGVDLSAYRIVQEALTNTLKHAGEAHARVLLRYAPDAIEIEVADVGRGAPLEAAANGGQGLIGMRERVQLFGGTLESGPRPGGGFLVRARLPALEEASS